jgi:hypothetical protein
MKKNILALLALAALASACGTNTGTPVTNGGTSNANSPANANTVTAANNANVTANAKNTASTKTGKSTETTPGSERLQIAPGKNEVSVKRTVPANGSLDFVFNARSGQMLYFSANYDKGPGTDIELFLTEPGLQDISTQGAANEPFEFRVKKTGDHRVTVQNTSGKSAAVDFGIVIK